MSSDYDRIIRALQSGISKLTTTDDPAEFYMTLRTVGAIATHEAKKLNEVIISEQLNGE